MEDFDPLSKKPPSKRTRPWGVNFGGGTNSVALVVELVKRGFKPDWVLFADTGSEKPETYAAIVRAAEWLESQGVTFSVTRWWRQRGDGSERTALGVRRANEAVARLARWERWIPEGGWFETLEDYCLRTGYMPSAAYGYGGCSTKFKRQPAERWRAQHGFSETVYCLGFDSGEERRVNKRKCDRAAEGEQLGEDPWYPLYAWGISRERCEEIVEESGLGPVPKSACWFCPYTKTPRVARAQGGVAQPLQASPEDRGQRRGARQCEERTAALAGLPARSSDHKKRCCRRGRARARSNVRLLRVVKGCAEEEAEEVVRMHG